MAVSDITVILLLGTLINYELIYRRNSLFGNIIFLGLGILIMTLENSNTYNIVGIIFLIGSILGITYDLVRLRSKSNRIRNI